MSSPRTGPEVSDTTSPAAPGTRADRAPWPTGRGSRQGIVLQFGDTRADIAQRALTTGDPLADAVVAAMRSGQKHLREQLNHGLRHGLGAIQDPHPAIAALLSQTEAMPWYATDELLDEGGLPFFSMPQAAHIVSLSAGALIRVYQSPSIANVLTTTGRLIDGTERRIRETGKWVTSVMFPGSLRPGGEGYIATVQVRMLHAQMREVARQRDFAEEVHGAPINQVDLARTWMDFTVTMLEAETSMGLALTSSETATYYTYWWVVAHLLGIEPELVEGITSNEQAHRVDALYQAVTGPLNPQSKALSEATLSSIATLLKAVVKLPRWAGIPLLNELARRFHPPPVSDELGLRRNPLVRAIIGIGIWRLRRSRLRLRADESRWKAYQTDSIASSKQVLAGSKDALYATHEP